MPSSRRHSAGANPRRSEICNTAARTFVERGYDATSVNDVAKALGVTKAGLYHYISSKEALFFDIVTLGMDALEERVVKAVKDIEDPEERLRQILRRHATLTATNEPWITVLLDEMHALPPARRKRIEERKRAYLNLVRDTLIELKSAGKLRDIHPTVGAFGVLGMIIWLSRWVRPNGRLTGEQIAEQIVSLAMYGLVEPSRAQTRPKRRVAAARKPVAQLVR